MRSQVGAQIAGLAGHASFGRDRVAGSVAGPGRQGAGDQPLVVAALAVVPAVGVRGVEQVHATVERRMHPIPTTGTVFMASDPPAGIV
jgi:hypothetical protein